MKANLTKEKLLKVIDSSLTMTEAWVKLEPRVDYKTFKKYAKSFNLWKPNQGVKGKIKPLKRTKEEFINEILILNGYRAWKTVHKKRLYEYGLKEERCEICGQYPEWNGKSLVLQIDHKNGNRKDNRLENLRIICPNCHTQTDTFSCKRSRARVV